MQDATPEQIGAFIARWEKSGGHERGCGQQILLESRELLGLERPAPPVPENERNAYTFERRVDRNNPHFPALRSSPMALSGASRRKQSPSSPPSPPRRWNDSEETVHRRPVS